MTGLLEKDFRLILQNRQQLIFWIVISVIIGFSQEGTFVMGYIPFCAVVFVTSLLAYDEADHGLQFLMTLPVSRRTYVKEKYFLCGGSTFLGWFIAMVLYFMSRAVHGQNLNVLEDMPLLLAFLPAFLLFLALMIPVQLKFGIEKSRFVLLGIGGFITTAAYLASRISHQGILKEMLAFLDSIGDVTFAVLGGVLTLVLVGVSYLVSQKIMSKREF